MKTPLLPSLLAVAGGLAAAGALAAPASAATAWNCGASSVYASVLGQPATAPFVANGGAAECKNARASHQPLDASSPLSAGLFVAQTELVGDQPATQVAKASGGVAELRVRSLPTLPVELPALTLDDALGSVSVPLTGALQPLVDDLNAQIADLEVALLGTVAGAGTGTVKGAGLLDGSTGELTGTVEGLLGGSDLTGLLDGASPESPDSTGTLLDGLTGELDGLTGPLSELTDAELLKLIDTLKEVRARILALPETIELDLREPLSALAPDLQLPTMDLLAVRSGVALAEGRCVNGQPKLTGAGWMTGLSVLGQETALNGVLERSTALLDPANLDPSNLDLGALTLPGGLRLDDPLIGALLTQAIGGVLAGLPDIDLPATVADVRVTPPQQTASPTAVWQNAGRVQVSIAGQPVVDTLLGLASVSHRGVDCAPPQATRPPQATPPPPEDTDSGEVEGTEDGELECTKRRLLLSRVVEGSKEVRLSGKADKRLAGKTVRIRFDATGKTVASAKVRADGTFKATAPLPPKRLRDTNRARYQAVLGDERSLDLKLRRRMRMTSSAQTDNGTVRIAGKVTGPLGKPLRSIEIRRRVSCTKWEVIAHVKPNPRTGWFKAFVEAPAGKDSAVYRATTQVRNNTASAKHYETFTLPHSVTLEP